MKSILIITSVAALSCIAFIAYLEDRQLQRREAHKSEIYLRYKGAVVERDKDDIEAFYIHVKDSLSPNRLHLSRVKGLKLVNFTTATVVALEKGDEWEPDPYTLFVRIGAAFPQDSVLMQVIDILNEPKVKHGK